MFKNFNGRFVLGSTSPRRRDILKMVDLEFVQKSPQFDETELMKRTDLSPENLVKLIAENKAENVADLEATDFLICCDTVIASGAQIFGKPADRTQQLERLKSMNGGSHSVFSGVCLKYKNKTRSFSVESKVNFGDNKEELLEWYVSTGDGMDKAGGYGLQSAGAVLVKSIEGCYYNVMGLPLHQLLREIDLLLE
ncbi:Oidioi.mRNA.OKI2018_I69.PAR.g8516.t1.cds [Oikopleura dioica]|uniref:Oidioi.mRNA.OKI2018_I69.PAR.g8516.t1.cds n=1 Tax=Oikopleura dioica TaxID=34765 RepID=A0ABN7RHE4_OIKDI|nr:Oidioi.mRNA.OKI2018_I69.PAR.g8516.t1.cds [Oikopleura dioica]